MIVPEFEYLVPESVHQACTWLSRYGDEAKVLAGGSDLIVKMKHGLLKPKYVVSLKALPELRGVRYEPGRGVVIGARTTHNEVAASPVLRERFRSVCGAAGTIAAHQICNVGTVGGNLVNAVPSADMPPILMALGARARIAGPASEREIELEDFFYGPGRTALHKDEILTELVIPDQPTTGSNYYKFGLRRAGALAVVGVATSVVLAGNVIEDVRIVLGAVAPVPMRAKWAESVLRGKAPSKELFTEAAKAAATEAKPITDMRGTAEYRRNLVGVLTRRSLTASVEQGHA